MKGCFKPYMTSYDSFYTKNVIALLLYCIQLIFLHFLQFTQTKEGVIKIAIFLKKKKKRGRLSTLILNMFYIKASPKHIPKLKTSMIIFF